MENTAEDNQILKDYLRHTPDKLFSMENNKWGFMAVSTDDLDDKQVRVTIIIPPLIVKRNFFKGFSLEPANAEILPKFETRSLTVIAHVKLKDATIVNYRVHIRKLPKEIVPERCSYAVKKEMIILTLIKKEAQSWAAKLSESGLEQASDEET